MIKYQLLEKDRYMKKEKFKQKSDRKWFYKRVKSVMRLFVKMPNYISYDDKLEEGCIYLCNHVGSTVPIKMELYFPHYFRMWGTYENASTNRERRKYMKDVYFLKKKHNTKFMANLKANLAFIPLGWFYKGMNFIKTYPDMRFKKTINESIDYLSQGKSVFIFPEDSSDGYHDVLKEYKPGFLMFAKRFYEETKKDVLVYNMYYRKTDNTLIVDKPVRLSKLLEDKRSKTEIANEYKDRANYLATVKDKSML